MEPQFEDFGDLEKNEPEWPGLGKPFLTEKVAELNAK